MASETLQAEQPARAAAPCRDPERVLAALQQARARTLALVAPLSEGELERSHSPIMSPLVWDLGHIAAYEDLWLAHRLGGLELLRPELAERYDAFETPRSVRGEIAILGTADAREYMHAVRARVAEALARTGAGDAVVCEMVIRHELQHTETMRQTMAIAGLLAPGEPRLAPMDAVGDWIEIEGGLFWMGAPEEGFAYDNERPRHAVELPAFRIARLPVSNEDWMRFSEDGGYAQRRWWSEQGWDWMQQGKIGPHPQIAAGHPQAPACHVSFFEAEAFARAHGARLPSEAEWERAAGVLQASAQVWEWTHSPFRGYPGFRAHPYREYSEVFFGDSYRVLRGGSWATAPRVASATFRNWDLPERRQIFAGARLAKDAA
jgi:iron(II)-dependent oxidoreductase